MGKGIAAEAFKEQMAVHGKTLTALGSYWKPSLEERIVGKVQELIGRADGP